MAMEWVRSRRREYREEGDCILEMRSFVAFQEYIDSVVLEIIDLLCFEFRSMGKDAAHRVQNSACRQD